MTQEWVPVWVQRAESERDGYIRERAKHEEMTRQYTAKIAEINEALKPWTERDKAGTE